MNKNLGWTPQKEIMHKVIGNKLCSLFDKVEDKFYIEEMTIAEWMKNYQQKTDHQPVGQRLPTDYTTTKAEKIILNIWKGGNVGAITLCEVDTEQYQYESIDGGHRKRAIRDYIAGHFSVGGKFWSELTIQQKKNFYNKKLVFVIYKLGLTNFEKGELFRDINTSTDVKHQEMLNSFGDIAVANVIRETVRIVANINNEINDLFTKEGDAIESHKFKYLSKYNLQLKQEEFLSKVYFRFWKKFNDKNEKNFVGSASDEDLETMFNDSTDKQIKKISLEVKPLLKFLKEMAIARNNIFKKKLEWKEQVSLTHLYFYMKDTFGKFKIVDFAGFYKQYNTIYVATEENMQIIEDNPIDKDGISIGVHFTNYAKEWGSVVKINKMLEWLTVDFDFTNTEIFQDLDIQRLFPMKMKQNALTKQGYKCYIDGTDLPYDQAEAAHILAWSEGGRTTVDNIAMVHKKYNQDMGTMNVEEYKIINGYA